MFYFLYLCTTTTCMVRVCVKQDKRIIDMNYALIIAGGSGNRMGQDIPKQFMHVDNCPIIIHTMMAFQKHPDIQGIAVVCLLPVLRKK